MYANENILEDVKNYSIHVWNNQRYDPHNRNIFEDDGNNLTLNKLKCDSH
jgi:hypothetical protein